MPRLLAIDTSTDACSVAYCDGVNTVENFVEAPREHMLRLLPMVDELLHSQGVALRDLDAIAFGRGPGSFTGLRICLGAVQGLAFGAELPVIAISTLAALAQTALTRVVMSPGSRILSAIDARMDEVYWGWFQLGDDGLVESLGAEQVSAPEAVALLPESAAQCYGFGSGWNYRARLPQGAFAAIDSAVLPRAAAVARLALPQWRAGNVLTAEQALPVYLRDNVAWAKSD
jgi:tRNA threonylcarbamoyladenosine biosynthesis protein TsaB